jgi:hypothetical protein
MARALFSFCGPSSSFRSEGKVMTASFKRRAFKEWLKMRWYEGFRAESLGGAEVYVRDDAWVGVSRRSLRPRYDLRNHSPDGFQWGYGGSGPAQLALALLADALADDERAKAHYQAFKFAVIAALLTDHWRLTRDEIIAWTNAQPAEGGMGKGAPKPKRR